MVVLYDGECGFCDASVQWVLARDRRGTFRFAPLQGSTAAGIRAAHPELPADLDSIIVMDGERLFWRSAAIFRICAQLGGAWGVVAWLRVLPAAVTDLGYRLFAAHRHRVFGRLDACRVPSPAQRALFLP
jgi:predicted DCC family thiol-disulfide oxidoreductase YuxK